MPTRRRLLQHGAAVVAGLALPIPGWGGDFWSQPRELWLIRGRESVKAVYWADGKLIPEGYVALCRVLRDVQLNLAVQIDPVTLDILRGVYGWLRYFGIDRPITVLSGYRHPYTNARTERAALNSLHMLGQAADIRIPGVAASRIAQLGKYLSAGGVGYYPADGFTHLDRGKLRAWTG
ncbi:hypothetical protein UB46_29240 [Burkholderiaceae bacterium 16]|nr:hypothetical protein UB46_29240 [Burkholderiaceae bacterium 16]